MPSTRELVLRLGAALILGALAGVERQWHHKHAGVRTHTLVAVGAAAFTLVSVALAAPNGSMVIAAGVGLLFVPASLLLPRNAGYGGAYFVIALVAQMAVLVAATWLLLGKVERVSALLKGAMVIGLIALVAGKVA